MGKRQSNPIDYNHMAAEYARNRKVHAGVFGELSNAVQKGSAHRILEIGCGTGNYIRALQGPGDCQAWGLDPSSEMLRRAAGMGGNVNYILGRGEEIPLAGNCFDLVYSVDAIHHITDRAAFYHEAYRVLRPSGRICTVTDSEAIIRAREPLAVFFPEIIDVELSRYPPIPWLHKALSAAGFDELSENRVEITSTITDIRPFREKAMSSLHLISKEAYENGMRKLEAALERGPIPAISRYVLIWGAKPALSG